jgi:hypothetical protein
MAPTSKVRVTAKKAKSEDDQRHDIASPEEDVRDRRARFSSLESIGLPETRSDAVHECGRTFPIKRDVGREQHKVVVRPGRRADQSYRLSK